ncbi:hypothetical protein [Endozoicomonas sp. 2B-B]
MLLSDVCQAEPLTLGFIVELQQDTSFSNQSFSITTHRRTLPDDLPDIADKTNHSEKKLPPEVKRHKPYSYGIRAAIIESISWQLLYAANLLATHELTLTTKGMPVDATSHSWLPVEAVVVVGWLLKSYWNPDSPMFNQIEQQEMTSMLARWDQPIVITTMMQGSGNNQPQGQLSESSGQQAPQATSQPASSFFDPQYSGYGNGSGDPQQYLHTLGLDCFVHPCHGVCEFRPSYENVDPVQRSLNVEESLVNHAGATHWENSCPHLANSHCYRCIRHSDNAKETSNDPPDIQLQWAFGQLFQPNGIDSNFAYSCNLIVVGRGGQSRLCGKVFRSTQALLGHAGRVHSGKKICDLTLIGEDGQKQPCGKVFKNAKTLSEHKRGIHSKQMTCNKTVTGEDNQPRTCGKVCKNTKALSNHRRQDHSGQQTCNVMMVGEDGQQRPCRQICKNSRALCDHKRSTHTGQQTCDFIILREDSQPRVCGTICRSAESLSEHKRNEHTVQQTCDVVMVTEDGQRRPCGKVYKNKRILWHHKKYSHTGQQICDFMVVGEDGQTHPCGKVCWNAKILHDHKRNAHRQQICDLMVVGQDGQQRPCATLFENNKALLCHKRNVHNVKQNCDVTVVGMNGQPRPCGKVCKSIQALSCHKSRYHSGQQTCNAILVGEDGQQQPCGKVYKNVRALSEHKRIHRKRKPVDADHKDGLSPP